MTAVSVKNVTIAYDGREIVKDVSFTLKRGGWLAVVGENGSGKSTLVKGIIGVNPLAAGEIIFGDGKRQIGYVPQQTKARRDFPASVGEVVLSGRAALLGRAPFFTAEDKKTADLHMERLGIAGLRDRPYGALSGGEQRRALLARAFCAARGLLVLDEPTAGLDPLIAAEFYHLLRGFKEETNTAIIMVSHDVGAAVANAGEILHLEGGVKFYGAADEYAESPPGRSFLGCYHG